MVAFFAISSLFKICCKEQNPRLFHHSVFLNLGAAGWDTDGKRKADSAEKKIFLEIIDNRRSMQFLANSVFETFGLKKISVIAMA